MKTIRVRPVDGGWNVESDLDLAPLAFLSGAAAERQAMQLARVLAGDGVLSQVIIHDRSDAVVGSRLSAPRLRLVR